jgi:hypothetical protein
VQAYHNRCVMVVDSISLTWVAKLSHVDLLWRPTVVALVTETDTVQVWGQSSEGVFLQSHW